MKFITEDDLRLRYRNEPFTIYDPEPGTRLTPGARQFLIDRRIEMPEETVKVQPVIRESITKEICCSTANPSHNKGQVEKKAVSGDWRIHMLRAKMDTIMAMFLKAEHVLLKCDISVAQQLTELGKHYESIRSMVQGKGSPTEFPFPICEDISSEEISDNMVDRFEVTEFHVQLENGMEILTLNELRCGLGEIYPIVHMAVDGKSLEIDMADDLISRINMIIDHLSGMICIAIGGKACQR